MRNRLPQTTEPHQRTSHGDAPQPGGRPLRARLIETTMPRPRLFSRWSRRSSPCQARTFHARRQIESKLNDRKIHAWVADPNVPDSRKGEYFDLPDEDDISNRTVIKKAPRLVQPSAKACSAIR